SPARDPQSGRGRNRRRRRRERLLDDPQHPRAPTFLDRLQTAELQPHELDAPVRAHRLEAEVDEEVAREDGPVDDEALVRGETLRVAEGERLERPRTLVPRFSDRGEEE